MQILNILKKEQKRTTFFMKKYHKYQSAMSFVKSMVESTISHPEEAYDVIVKIADRIEELEKNKEIGRSA